MNWKNGHYTLTRMECHSKRDELGVCCLQYDDNKIVSGHRDSTIKVCVCTECMRYCVDVYIQACTELVVYLLCCVPIVS